MYSYNNSNYNIINAIFCGDSVWGGGGGGGRFDFRANVYCHDINHDTAYIILCSLQILVVLST